MYVQESKAPKFKSFDTPYTISISWQDGIQPGHPYVALNYGCTHKQHLETSSVVNVVRALAQAYLDAIQCLTCQMTQSPNRPISYSTIDRSISIDSISIDSIHILLTQPTPTHVLLMRAWRRRQSLEELSRLENASVMALGMSNHSLRVATDDYHCGYSRHS